MNWALQQQLPPGRAAAKHVLTIIANQANVDPENAMQQIAFMSIDYLVWATGQNRKTVIANIQLLQEWGLIEDTGRRVGRTRQIPIYRVACGPDLFHEQSRKRNSSQTGTVPESEQFRRSPETVPNFPETVPISGHGTKSNKSNRGGSARVREDLDRLNPFERDLISPYLDTLPEAIATDVFVAFVKHRRVKGATLSISAWQQLLGQLRALAAEGVDLNESLRQTMALGLSLPVDPRPKSRAGPGRARTSDDFTAARYKGTPDDELPDFLRSAASADA